MGFFGFDGIDWDIEGNDDESSVEHRHLALSHTYTLSIYYGCDSYYYCCCYCY